MPGSYHNMRSCTKGLPATSGGLRAASLGDHLTLIQAFQGTLTVKIISLIILAPTGLRQPQHINGFSRSGTASGLEVPFLERPHLMWRTGCSNPLCVVDIHFLFGRCGSVGIALCPLFCSPDLFIELCGSTTSILDLLKVARK